MFHHSYDIIFPIVLIGEWYKYEWENMQNFNLYMYDSCVTLFNWNDVFYIQVLILVVSLILYLQYLYMSIHSYINYPKIADGTDSI